MGSMKGAKILNFTQTNKTNIVIILYYIYFLQ